ncbi:hypothetical protein TRFO_35734 [Tritrichomonas foetus]|uniref:DNA replication complex GINS protein PSF3 n=1 Tax=Tritrichomonas foetus TaxID=1144522 RepID=A0A1J4JFL6_9EUKA|nr:hypothetical protein TRFO_35734 [Tritrichomonas foetus]|eukprot:OHS97938.1 hypothetical protein TRFO_35734 [Tritrichomonas foetus]
MTREEIDIFRHNEELVPVVFLQSYQGLGFIVDPSKNDAEIPEGFRANLPFWLAKLLADSKVKMVIIEQPQWLEKLGPGSTISEELSYSFGASIGESCGKEETIRKLIELGKSRLEKVVNSSFKVTNRQLDRQEQPFLVEENEMIQNSRVAYNSFLQWKTGDLSPV